MSTATEKLIETHRNGGEVYQGEVGFYKIANLMEELSFPTGTFPVSGLVEESGYNRTAGFFWVRLKKKKEHKFESIGQTVIYGPLVAGFFAKGRLSKLTGIKGKEPLIPLPIPICDVRVGDPSPDMIKFSTTIGLSKSHPYSAFQLQDGGK